MRNIKLKKSIAALLIIFALASVLLTGCGQKVPETTSEEAGLYLLGDTVVDIDGQELLADGKPVYGLASNGDIISLDDNKIIVAAYNVQELTCASEAKVIKEDSLSAKVSVIPVSNDGDEGSVTESTTWKIKIKISPNDAINKKVRVETSNEYMLCFGHKDKSVNAEADGSGNIEIEVTARYGGEVKLTVYNCADEEIGTLKISIDENDVGDSAKINAATEKVNNCKHSFRDEKISSTGKNGEYTIHVCTKCGFATKADVEVGENEDCEHEYTTKVIAPTATEKGYTLHTCSLCGDTYKDNYTDKTGGQTQTQTRPSNPTRPTQTQRPVATPKPTAAPKPTTAPVETQTPVTPSEPVVTQAPVPTRAPYIPSAD